MRAIRYVICALAFATFACSDQGPPLIGDIDSGTQKHDASGAPCSTPAPGCPCAEAGEQFDCGRIYIISGTHVDCAEGQMTCQEDGGWSACVAPPVFDGGS